MESVNEFINRLSTAVVECRNNSERLYGDIGKEERIRKNNLSLYLEKMKSLQPEVLLLGEAPGYRGCRLTGVPFTSEKILKFHPFFKNQSYQFINSDNELMSEQSATIIWNVLDQMKTKPLIWNIFPYHPFKENDLKTNRTPCQVELGFGKELLMELLDIFSIKKIIAVGRKSESQIMDLNLDSMYVRHPANGGKQRFVEGMKKIKCL